MPVVMLVDDEIGALKLMGIMLERGGFGVVEVRDAGQCLDCVDDVEPDLIITDIMMPGMNGIDLCKILRLRIGTRATPILILSARGDAESIIHGVEAGATDYLHKPILHHELLSKIREILSNTSVMPHIDWETAQHERRLQRLF